MWGFRNVGCVLLPDASMATNPELLITALDEGLDHEVSLVVYGRAAIALGFDNVPGEVNETLGIDAIIRLSQLDELVNDDQFWDARDRVNERFKDKGLYITHLFQEDQVFLRENWESEIVPVTRPETCHLRLCRPATIDLILTKMMRGDDRQDMRDIEFLVHHDSVTRDQLESSFRAVQIPDVQELRDAFERASPNVLAIADQFSRAR